MPWYRAGFLLTVLLAAPAFATTVLPNSPGIDFHLAYGRARRVIRTQAPMDQAVVSWNVTTPGQSSVDIYLRARRPDRAWTKWYHLATWGTGIGAKSDAPQQDADGAVDIDTLKLTAATTTWQYRIDRHRDRTGQQPAVHAIAVAFKNSRTFRTQDTSRHAVTPIAVPAFSQFEVGRVSGDPDLGRRICSPTSVAMVLNYHGLDIAPLDMARRVVDRFGAEPYGNWPFNAAAMYDATRWTTVMRWYESFDEVLAHVQHGRPVVVSIGFKAGELTGAPRPTPGHLVVVRGADSHYVYVNDPAAPTGATVPRRYHKSEFLRAWKGVAYVVQK